MSGLGERIRELRKEQNLPLRVVAAMLDVDQAILSKIERGLRKANRAQVIKLAEFFKVDENELLVCWLSDKLLSEVVDEDVALRALKVAEDRILYEQIPNSDRSSVIQAIKGYLKRDRRVEKAWIFGSFARGEDKPGSDIDLLVRYSGEASGTLLDYADLKDGLQKLLNRKVDLAEEGFVKPFAWKQIQKDLTLIYG